MTTACDVADVGGRWVRVAPVVEPPHRPLRDRHLFRDGRKLYLATRTSAASPELPYVNVDRAIAASGEDTRWIEHQLQHGGAGTFLMDMQGIDCFMFGRAKMFTDAQARRVAHAMLPFRARKRYLRVGAAGAPPSDGHPGGEVLEHSELEGSDLSGWSASVAGHLPPGEITSVSTSLGRAGQAWDARSIYSHTAFLPRQPLTSSLVLDGLGQHSSIDLLAWTARQASIVGIQAYAIRVRATARKHGSVRVRGRVLRHLPHGPLEDLDAAARIASEVTFTLDVGQSIVAYGTHYRRRAPEWEAFRGGKPYEPYGHVHFQLEPYARKSQHAVAHLRELVLDPSAAWLSIVDPAQQIVRADPVQRRGDTLVTCAGGRPVATLDGGPL